MTHLMVIPTYDAGMRLLDGSTDGSDAALTAGGGLRVIRRGQNGGTGAAVLDALCLVAAGFTHALVMDADGRHPAAQTPAFMAASQAQPDAMVLGVPQFGPDAPAWAWRYVS